MLRDILLMCLGGVVFVGAIGEIRFRLRMRRMAQRRARRPLPASALGLVGTHSFHTEEARRHLRAARVSKHSGMSIEEARDAIARRRQS